MELAFEDYPKDVTLAGGTACILRLLEKSDARALHEFFSALPPGELISLQERVTDLAVLRQKCRRLDWERELTLLAVQERRIIGHCLLQQQLGGWKRHIGHLNVLVHPQYRGRGLGRALVTEMILLARQCGLERLETELIGEQPGALRLLSLLGFSVLWRQPDYVKDMQAFPREYILLGVKLGTDEEFAGVG